MLIDKTVLITCGDAMGAGFYVKENLVATARHVVDGCTKASIENNSHRTSSGVVIIKKTDLDIAFISSTSTIAPVVVLDKGAKEVGEAVSIVGAPIDGLVLSTGKITDYNHSENKYRLTLDIPADHGNSGGPIFSEKGLIGLIIAKSNFGQIYGYDEAQLSTALSAEANSRTQDVQNMMSDNSQLENLLFGSTLINAVFLIVIIFLVAKRKRYNKNQVVINI